MTNNNEINRESMSKAYNLLNRLSKTDLFRNLDEKILSDLIKKSYIRSYNRNNALVIQGDIPYFIYFVIEGKIKTSKIDSKGDEVIIRMLQEDDICMETVAFMEVDSPINIEVIKNCKLLIIPIKLIKELTLKNTQLTSNLLKIVATNYKNAMHQIETIAIKPSLQRVGYYLLNEHIKQIEIGEFTLPFKKSMIANHLGMKAETFSRTLMQMKQIGINIKRNTIKLDNTSDLCGFCDIESAYICHSYSKNDLINKNCHNKPPNM